MKYLFETEYYNIPELLEQDELDKDMKFFEELQDQLTKAKDLYNIEVFKRCEK